MTTKKCSKGYSCGRTCINRERSCSKELAGQSIEIASQLANSIQKKDSELKTITSYSEIRRLFQRQWQYFDYDELPASYQKEDSETMRDIFMKLLSNEEPFDDGQSYIGVVDKKGQLQGVAIYTKKIGYVDDLMSAPWNLSKEDPRKVRGAGTRLLAEAAKAIDDDVSLFPLQSAGPFYEKLGFKWNKFYMTLDKADGQKLIEKVGI